MFSSFFKRQPKVPVESLGDRLSATLATMSRKSILFVDDDLLLQEMMTEVQKHMKVEVTSAFTAGAARHLIEARKFDLAILDVGVINGDGLELYRWIKERFPRLSVVFLTGGSMDEICPKVHAIGSAPVYHKPTVNTLHFLTDLLRFVGAKPA